MKNITKIVIAIYAVCAVNFLSAQPADATITLYQCSSYAQKPEMDKYVGTWKWTSGNDSFEIILRKEKVFDISKDDLSCEDVIIGFHKYIKNGVVVESSLQHQNTTFTQRMFSIFGVGEVPGQILWAGLDILSNGNHVKMELKYTDASHLFIKSIKNYQGVQLIPVGTPIPSSEIIFPDNIVLTKQ